MKTKTLTKGEHQLDLNFTKHFDFIFNSFCIDTEKYNIYANKDKNKINEEEFIRFSETEFQKEVVTSWSLKRYFIELNLQEIIFLKNNKSFFKVEWIWLGKLKYSTLKKHKFVKLKVIAYNDSMEDNEDDFFELDFLNLESYFF